LHRWHVKNEHAAESKYEQGAKSDTLILQKEMGNREYEREITSVGHNLSRFAFRICTPSEVWI